MGNWIRVLIIALAHWIIGATIAAPPAHAQAPVTCQQVRGDCGDVETRLQRLGNANVNRMLSLVGGPYTFVEVSVDPSTCLAFGVLRNARGQQVSATRTAPDSGGAITGQLIVLGSAPTSQDGCEQPRAEPCEEGGGFGSERAIPDCDPLLLDFGRFGFDLTGPQDGVSFDIDGDGVAEQVGWTRSGALDAFLVLDRNGNGRIDDGTELFGNATPLADGSLAANGYAALAELDSPAQGGNGNGLIDRGDRAYSALQLWTDLDHDGISQNVELVTLQGKGVLAIRLDFRTSMAMDENGNQFRFVSSAYVRGPRGPRAILTTDVFLVLQPSLP